MSACSNQGESVEIPKLKSTQTNYTPYVFSGLRLDKGLMHQENSAMRFLDYETMSDVSICSKPNCSHDMNSSDCAAYFGDASYMFVYGGKLLYFDFEFALEDGIFSDYSLWSADFDGTNRQKVLDIGICDFTGNGSFICGNKLYIEYKVPYYDEGDDTMAGSNKYEMYLAEIDLDTFEIKKSELIFKGFVSQLAIHGCKDGKLYVSLMKYPEGDGEIEYLYYEYDTQSGKFLQTESFGMLWCSDDVFVEYNDGKISVESAEKRYELPFDFYPACSLIGNELFLCDYDNQKVYALNVENGSLEECAITIDGNEFSYFTVLEKYGNYYIFSVNETDGQAKYKTDEASLKRTAIATLEG